MATSRPFAYNTGATIDGTEQLGSLAIGIPTTGFTNSPKFYMGPDEDNRYIIAGPVSGGTQPSSVSGETASLQFWGTKVKTDNELMNLARSISKFTQTFGSASAAKTWLNNNGYWTSYGGLVTDGLVLNLDAGNPASYPGTGTTWNDLSGNGYVGTLTNNPTFNSSNGGQFIFDGNNDYVITNYTQPIGTGDFTYATWIKYTESQVSGLFSKRIGSPSYSQFALYISGDVNANEAGTKISIVDYNNGGRLVISNNSYNDGNWHYVVATRSNSGCNLYVDGISQQLTGDNTIGSPNLTNSSPLFIGVGGNDTSPLSGFNFNGSMAVAQMYNRALTQSEILQNYNATKTRFLQPVSNGLILHLDAANIASYSGTGTTWTDLAGNANGTINGNVSWVNNGNSSYFNFPNGSTNTGYISSTTSQNYLDVSILFQPDFSYVGQANIAGLIGNNAPNSNADKSLRFEGVDGTGPWNLTFRNPGDANDWAGKNNFFAPGIATTYYINGVTGLTLSNGWNVLGGARTNIDGFGSNFQYFLGSSGFLGRNFQGKIAAVLMYNRTLSEAEQIQNYNYLISRFQ